MMRKTRKRSARKIFVINPTKKHRRRKARKIFGNPRRRRYHRNPKIMSRLKGLTSKRSIMSIVSYGGGVVAGFLTPTILGMVLPATYRKYFGIASIGVAALIHSFIKNPQVKNAALVMGGFGAYDLLTQNMDTGLPVLGGVDKVFGFQLSPTLKGSYTPARPLGMSYTPLGKSYGPKSSMSGATNPYENLMM
jgi:hypothetical protein